MHLLSLHLRDVHAGLCELAFDLLPPKDTLKPKALTAAATAEDDADAGEGAAERADEETAATPPPPPPPAAAAAADGAAAVPMTKFKKRKLEEQARCLHSCLRLYPRRARSPLLHCSRVRIVPC